EPAFVELFENVRAQLGSLVGGRDVALFLGSGTLANDVVAATLSASASPGRGLILDNGAFGTRLVSQAARFGLSPRVLSWPWGSPWNLDEVAAALDQEPARSWVWGVHHESSTGVLNDLPALVRLARSRDVRVCADCVSSIGAVPLDLSDVYLASGTSGKALASGSGIALVFGEKRALRALDTTRVPSYLDLAATLTCEGPRFTFPSGLLCGLSTALTEYATADRARARYEGYATVGQYVRRQLRRMGLPPMASERDACPTLSTFAPWAGWTSPAFVDLCRIAGYLIAGQSTYLTERRLVQIATMGAITRGNCASLFEFLERARTMGQR
ncbi:MAG TPA: aminotransferase class V-fold PLP-dependent enzyme, partial [Planctomycetaceae bacterium]